MNTRQVQSRGPLARPVDSPRRRAVPFTLDPPRTAATKTGGSTSSGREATGCDLSEVPRRDEGAEGDLPQQAQVQVPEMRQGAHEAAPQALTAALGRTKSPPLAEVPRPEVNVNVRDEQHAIIGHRANLPLVAPGHLRRGVAFAWLLSCLAAHSPQENVRFAADSAHDAPHGDGAAGAELEKVHDLRYSLPRETNGLSRTY